MDSGFNEHRPLRDFKQEAHRSEEMARFHSVLPSEESVVFHSAMPDVTFEDLDFIPDERPDDEIAEEI